MPFAMSILDVCVYARARQCAHARASSCVCARARACRWMHRSIDRSISIPSGAARRRCRSVRRCVSGAGPVLDWPGTAPALARHWPGTGAGPAREPRSEKLNDAVLTGAIPMCALPSLAPAVARCTPKYPRAPASTREYPARRGHLRIVRQRLELLWLLWLRSYWGSAAVSRCVRAVAGTAPACAARPRGQCLTHGLAQPQALRSATWTRADCCCAPTRTTLSGRFGSSQSASIAPIPAASLQRIQPPPQWPAGYSQA